ncbi:MAG: Holliday junction resolvase RuvX [Actinomycetota bacterium]|jgi:putative Holliday junction resolvase|nr:Holliday junction resolvase RuvX [Acidimicrobiaceae bacterium]MEC7916458.1 Holliday junction resolvase RuvX [Actinomycetota bacterium]MEC9057935.1 Holliday junction resolvase RuvX [Actinomycetota bacterium]MEE3257373.1 Holliday junction resolvase RuvX [Actinomycetota bacterium]
MRAVGIDLGEKRIGVAVSDSESRVATPYETVVRSGSRDQDHAQIRGIVEEVGAEILVVGLPLSLDGTEGKAAADAREEAEHLRQAVPIPLEMHDERLTTVEAERVLQEQGLDASQRRKVVDKVAASIILQAWMDAR